MEVIKHETCLEYFRRRLSEGWECISLEGHNAVLLSPEGFRRELDLRHDVETLRPNATGDEENIPYANPDVDHYLNINEETPDYDTTIANLWLWGVPSDYKRDLYNLPAFSGGTVNKITVYARCKRSEFIPGGIPKCKLAIKTGGTAYESSEKTLIASWADYSQEWATNPGTGNPWTPSGINSLQIGISLQRTGMGDFGNSSYCTQVYVEVDFTPEEPKPSPLPWIIGGIVGIGLLAVAIKKRGRH